MATIEEYQAKKSQYEAELEQVNRDIIIKEQSIKQKEEVFQQQFGTVNIDELNVIAQQYQEAIAVKEQELLALEQS